VSVVCHGSAGQSFGAYGAPGLQLTLRGAANDYVGKSLGGARIIICPPDGYRGAHPTLAGNTVLYGATAGELFIAGRAGERFAVRNSGASAVIEGIGDHGCEYMTGGRVVILGKTGRNFGAGMSGGIAYVWDPHGSFPSQCNMDTFELEPVSGANDILELKSLIENHANYTDSTVARAVLENWEASLAQFVKVMPTDFKRVLAERAAASAA